MPKQPTPLASFYGIPLIYRRSEQAQKLLRAVAERIENQPESYYQRMWGTYLFDVNGDTEHVHFLCGYGNTKEEALKNKNEFLPAVPGVAGVPEGACGTAFCIAGHAILEAGYTYKWDTEAWEQSDGKWRSDGYFKFVGLDGQPVVDPGGDAARMLSLEDDPDCNNLFREDWSPREDLTVSDALRLIADGASVESVSNEDFTWED